MSGIVIGLDNVGVATGDFAASMAFYVDKLGLELADHDGSVPSAVLEAGSTQLYLFATSGPDGLSRDADLTTNPTGVDHLSFAVDDVDASYDALLGIGVQFFLQPTDSDWGARICGCEDPGGTLIYLLTWPE